MMFCAVSGIWNINALRKHIRSSLIGLVGFFDLDGKSGDKSFLGSWL